MNSRTFLILTIIVALLSILLSFFVFKFSLWFWIFLIIWFVFTYFIYSSTEKTNFDIKKYAVVVVVLFSITLVSIFAFKPTNHSSNNTNTDSQSDKSEKNIYTLTQSDAHTSIYSVDKNQDNVNETVEASVTPFISLSKDGLYNASLVEFKIRNISLKNNRIGEVKVVAPKHIPNDTKAFGYYLEKQEDALKPNDVKDAGNTIEFIVVDGEANYMNEVGKNASLIVPRFKVIITDLGTFDHDAFMSRDGKFNSSKVAEYAGVDESKLGDELEYEIYMKFDDGTENSYKVNNKLGW